MAEELARWRRGEPTIVRPPGPVGRARRWARRHAALVRGAALTVVVGALIAVAAAAPWRTRRPEPDPPEPPVERINRLLRAGPVTVIPAEGLPDCENWAFGAVRLAPSPMNDGTYSFQTVGGVPGGLRRPERVGRYRVTVEVRQFRGQVPDHRGHAGGTSWPWSIGPAGTDRRRRDARPCLRGGRILRVGQPGEAKLSGGKGRAALDAYRVVQEPDKIRAPTPKGLAGPRDSTQPGSTPVSGEAFRRRSPRPASSAGGAGPRRPVRGLGVPCRGRRSNRRFDDVAAKVPAAEVRARLGGLPYTWDSQDPARPVRRARLGGDPEPDPGAAPGPVTDVAGD